MPTFTNRLGSELRMARCSSRSLNKSVPEFGSVPGESPRVAPTRTLVDYFDPPVDDEQAIGQTILQNPESLDPTAKEMLRIVDDLQRSTGEHKGNCLTAEIGSEKDRLYGRMVEKGLLVRGPFGYTLREYGGFAGRSPRFTSRCE
jgi:hypothetical protein